jgi:hypothetical protein
MDTVPQVDSAVEPLRAQLQETFETATFPVRQPADLLTVMATGRSVFVADGIELVALELAIACGDQLSFPYATAEELVEDVMTALRRSYRP